MANTKIPAELSSTPGIIDNSNATAITIDSSENVGIGTGSPQLPLHVKGDFPTAVIERNAGAAGAGGLVFTNSTTNGVYITGSDTTYTVGHVTDYEGSPSYSERLRIDSSGNLLVGTTDVDLGYTDGDTGVVASSNGTLQCARDSSFAPLYVQKLNNDGDLIEFNKDGGGVGSIGVHNSDNLAIEGNSTHSGLQFASNVILPHKNGALIDATVGLGNGSSRFADLFLSGGVYIGGTAAANKFDDYEEGTFTPTFEGTGGNPTVNYNTQSAIYTKIGNLVQIEIRLVTNSVSGGSGNLTIAGLPFASRSFNSVGGAMTKGFVYNWATDPEVFSTTGSSIINIYSSDAANTQAQVSDLTTSGVANYTNISGTYLI